MHSSRPTRPHIGSNLAQGPRSPRRGARARARCAPSLSPPRSRHASPAHRRRLAARPHRECATGPHIADLQTVPDPRLCGRRTHRWKCEGVLGSRWDARAGDCNATRSLERRLAGCHQRCRPRLDRRLRLLNPSSLPLISSINTPFLTLMQSHR